MITPELKNKVLEWLVTNAPDLFLDVNYDDVASEINTSSKIIDEMLNHFARKGLIKQQPYMGGGALVTIRIEAHDYIRHGGFVGEEEMLMDQFRKLQLEIESLYSDIDQNKYNKIMTGINSVFGFFALKVGQ